MKGLSQIYIISLSKSGSLKSPHRMNIFLYDCNKTEILLLFKKHSYTQNSRGGGSLLGTPSISLSWYISLKFDTLLKSTKSARNMIQLYIFWKAVKLYIFKNKDVFKKNCNCINSLKKLKSRQKNFPKIVQSASFFQGVPNSCKMSKSNDRK